MTTKKQRRSDVFKDRKKKKSTRLIYLAAIIGGIVLVLVIFFVILFNAVFPPVDMEALKKKEKRVEIYFSDPQERFLIPEKRYVYKESDPALQAKEVVKALLDGSKSGHVNTFPAGVTLRDVKVDKTGMAYVNFGKNLTKLHPGGSTAEMATIYSLTNSIIENVPGINKVKILMDDKEVPSIKGHISTLKAFQRDPDLYVRVNEGNN